MSPHPASRDLLTTCEDRKVGSSSSHRSRPNRAQSRAPACPRWPHYSSEVPSPRPHPQPINGETPPPNTYGSQRKPRCARQLAGLDNAGSGGARPIKVRVVMAFVTGIAAVAGRRAGAMAAAAAAPGVVLLGPARRDLELGGTREPTVASTGRSSACARAGEARTFRIASCASQCARRTPVLPFLEHFLY